MKTSVINTILFVVFALNAFGCVYNYASQNSHDSQMQAMAKTDLD